MPPDAPASPAGARPLAGLLVVALEQAVAAPYCSSRLADAGARIFIYRNGFLHAKTVLVDHEMGSVGTANTPLL